jgi:hypothetical protein
MVARRLTAIVAAALSAAQAFPYQRLDIPVPREGRFAVNDEVVYYAKGRALVGHPLDGRKDRTYRLPKDTQAVDYFDVNDHAVMVFAAGPEYRFNLAKLDGPLRTLKHRITTARLAGHRLVLLQGARDREWLRVRDLRTGKTKRLARPGLGLRSLLAAGNFVSIEGEDRRVLVLDVRTGKRVYSVRLNNGGTHRLLEDGRIVLVDGEFERIQLATPARPRLRTIARVHAAPYTLTTAGDDIQFVVHLSDSTGRIVKLTTGGTMRALTPRMPLGTLAYDGETLVFSSGTCVFAGPLPRATPQTVPADCSAEPPRVDG